MEIDALSDQLVPYSQCLTQLTNHSPFTHPNISNDDSLFPEVLVCQTDIGEAAQNRGAHEPMGNNAMLCADPRTGEIRRFLTGPTGQEITGVVMTPDARTLFVGVQHPGATTTPEAFAAGEINSQFPDYDGTVPRSATLVITRKDGGIIGA